MTGIPPVMWFIIGGIFLTLIAVSVLSNLLARGSRGWRALAERFPAQPPALEAQRGRASVELINTTNRGETNPGCLSAFFTPLKTRADIAWITDADHLHLSPTYGPTGAGHTASIPWAQITIRGEDTGQDEIRTDLGNMTMLAVGEYTIIVPSAMIADELAIRRSLRPAPSGAQPDPSQPPPFGIDAPPKSPNGL